MLELTSTGWLIAGLLFGGQFGLPLGLPPLPRDPVLARVAPEECLWYFSSSGVAEPDPKSKNQTEQLLAEPEVREFVGTLNNLFDRAIKKGAPPTLPGQVLGEEGPKLINALLTHPAAAFIAKLSASPQAPIQSRDIAGGIVVATGRETDELKATLERVETVGVQGKDWRPATRAGIGCHAAADH